VDAHTFTKQTEKSLNNRCLLARKLMKILFLYRK
jgi:hypothetical protein